MANIFKHVTAMVSMTALALAGCASEATDGDEGAPSDDSAEAETVGQSRQALCQGTWVLGIDPPSCVDHKQYKRHCKFERCDGVDRVLYCWQSSTGRWC